MFEAFHEARSFFPTAPSFVPSPPAGFVSLACIGVPVPMGTLETSNGPNNLLMFSNRPPRPL